MATKIKAKPGDLHERDFYVWSARQAELLRVRRFDELDLEHLIEEVEDLGTTLKNAVRNNARIVMEHLLKLEYSPAIDPRNKWRASVREHRRRLQTDLTPSLKRRLEDDLPQIYSMAREDAAASMHDHREDEAADALPGTCPYTIEQILGDWLP